MSKEKERVEDFIREDVPYVETLSQLLSDSEDVAEVCFINLRRAYELWKEEHCIGKDDDYCGMPKHKSEDFCLSCNEEEL